MKELNSKSEIISPTGETTENKEKEIRFFKNLSETEETKASDGKDIAEKAHLETKKALIENFGQAMPKEQLERIKSDDTLDHLHVMPPEQYHDQFKHPPEVLGHYDLKDGIYLKDTGRDDILKHCSVHETMHMCSYKNVEKAGDLNIYESGIRRSVTISDAGGKEIMMTNENTALNEGITELYTLRRLRESGELDAAKAISAYSDARMHSEQLEAIVGKEVMERSYFGQDKKALENEVKRLSGSDNAWTDLNKDMDLISYSPDQAKTAQANIRLETLFNKMMDRKEDLNG